MDPEPRQYAKRDAAALDVAGGYFCRHVAAMTREGLHGKANIAAELGYRDARIAELTAEAERLRAIVDCNPGMKSLQWNARGDASDFEINAAWKDGGLIWPYLAEEIARTIGNAPNFLTMIMTARDGRRYEVTMRRAEGKTPAVVIDEFQTRGETLTAALTGLLDAMPRCWGDYETLLACAKAATYAHCDDFDSPRRCVEHQVGADSSERVVWADAIEHAERAIGRRQ